jgi:hypothetical protein
VSHFRSGGSIGAVTFLAVLGAGFPSYAQAPGAPERPAQAIFQGDRRDTQSPRSLTLTGSIWEAYDTHVIGAESLFGAGSLPGVRQNGGYTSADAGLFYNRRGNRVRFGSSLDGTFAYYPTLTSGLQQPVDAYQATADVSVMLGRAELHALQTVGYQPYFVVQVLPSVHLNTFTNGFVDSVFTPAGRLLASETSILDDPGTVYSSLLSFRAPLGRRSSVLFSYGRQGSNYSGTFADLASHTGRVQVNHTATRSTEIYGAYGYQAARYDRAIQANRFELTEHDLEAGISHVRRVSPTRSLRFFAEGGGSTFREDRFVTPGASAKHQATARGGADLQLGRTWSARGEYSRSLQLLQGLAQPYFGNAVTLDVGGGLSERVAVALGTRYSQGGIGISTASRDYDTRTGYARMTVALSRQLALTGEYINTQYSFGSGAVLPSNVIRALDRQEARIGLTWGVSLFVRRTVRGSAP